MLNKKKIDGYSDLSDVITEIHDVFTVGLRDIVERLPKKLNKNFKQNPNGIYRPGILNPILNFDRYAYIDGGYLGVFEGAIKINSLEAFNAATTEMITVLTETDGFYVDHFFIPKRLRAGYKDTSSLPYSVIHALKIDIIGQLSDMLQDSYAQLFTNINERGMVKESFLTKKAADEDFVIPFPASLSSSIINFVGRDRFSTYHIRQDNCLLTISKGNDIRLIEYYRSRFQELEDAEKIVDPIHSSVFNT